MKTIKSILLITLCSLCLQIQAQDNDNINKFNKKGERIGAWKGYYDDSHILRYEGNFKNGVEVGLFTYYANSDKKITMATRNFNGKGGAYTIFFDEKGNKVSEGNVVNKLREGVWKYYHKGAKTIMCTENYVNDKLEGSRKVFYSDGVLAEDVTYQNDLKQGLAKKFSKEGKLVEESNYEFGLMQGSYTVYNENKIVVIKGQFKGDKKNGMWNYYDETGKLKRQINADTINGYKKPSLIKKK